MSHMLFKSRCDMQLPLSTVGLKGHVPCSIESMYTITYSNNFTVIMSNFPIYIGRYWHSTTNYHNGNIKELIFSMQLSQDSQHSTIFKLIILPIYKASKGLALICGSIEITWA